MEGSGDPPRDGIHFNADEPCSRLAVAHEVACAASRLQDRGVGGHAEAGDGLVDRRDHGGGCVEGVERGALGAVVFDGRKKCFQFLSDRLPAGIFELAGDRIGKDGKSDRTKAGEPGEDVLFFRRCQPTFCLDGL